jgi:hypothetical protein
MKASLYGRLSTHGSLKFLHRTIKYASEFLPRPLKLATSKLAFVVYEIISGSTVEDSERNN